MDRSLESQTKRHLSIIAAFMILLIAASLMMNLNHHVDQYNELGATIGRSFFQAVEAMRSWNMGHGGIYVQLSGTTPANEYLREPEREIVIAGRATLTKINHSHMIRIFSELLSQDRGIQIHLTSEKPLRPGNDPDPWEHRSFGDLKNGRKEVFEVSAMNGQEMFRYMAPLRAKESCLKCHDDFGYKSGDVLGGLSVSFPYELIRKLMRLHEHSIYLLHLLLFASSVFLLLIFGRKLMASVRALQETQGRMKRLEGLLPICARCKRIRQDGADPKNQAGWTVLEQFIAEHSDATFTHGLCPDCANETLKEVMP